MYKVSSFLLLLSVVLSPNLFAQLGPGGVGSTDGTSELVLWLNPDKGVNTDNVLEDQSGNNFNFTAGSGATLNSNDVNGYSAYNFNGTNQYLEKSFESKLNPNKFSVFSVSTVLPSDKYKAVFSNRHEVNSGDDRSGFILYAIPTSNNWSFWTGAETSWATTNSSNSTQGVWSIQNIAYKGQFSNGKNLFVNSVLSQSTSQNMLLNTTSPFRLGAGRNESTPDYYFKGGIGEIIMYNSVINDAQRIIVNNYLAAKYNIDIAEDYYTQDQSAKGNFDHNVAGIVKVDNLNQHLDSQGTGIIRISKNGLANNKFLFWGENNKNSNYSFSLNVLGDYKNYIDTMWRVSEPININAKLRVNIKKSDLNLTSTFGCAKLELVMADNPDFTGASVVVYDLSETATEYVYDVDGLGFDDGDYFTLRYVDKIVWDGSSAFHNGSGSAEVPNMDDACFKLEIKAGNTATLNENAHVESVEIKAGAILEIADGVELTVESGIFNEGIIDLQGEAQIIQKHTGASLNSGMGNLKITQQGSSNLYNYNYWSAPVNRLGAWQLGYLEEASGAFAFVNQNDADPTTSPMTLSSKWIYGFNAGQNNYYGWEYLGADSNILPGIGYTMKGSGASIEQDYIFKGTPNDGDYSYTVSAGNDFLVGNPYPSALNALQFISDNLPVIDGTIYFWEQFTTNNTHVSVNYQGGYATYNLTLAIGAVAVPNTNGGFNSKGKPTKNIAVGQGFFVNIITNGTLVFNNNQRVFAKESVLDESTFFKTNGASQNTVSTDLRTKLWLTFTDPSQRVREIGLGYDDNATTNYDKGYDALDYDVFPDHMLWDIQGVKYVIQGRNNFAVANEMPLAIKITTAGDYSIGLKETLNFPEATPIYLKDNVSGLYYNLKTEDASLFFEAGEYSNRYSIVYHEDDTLSADAIAVSDGISLIYDTTNQQLEIRGYDTIQNIKSLTVYSVLGQEIVTLDTVESYVIQLPKMSNGVYILEIVDVNNGKIAKKFVKD
ncbi:T9SS type A sorting domain-containing protein [Bizionia gelidisalsuginis]|uniref:T9SS type A sorting domain-containing protein n=1 Tax=Bizionia gelidisalsuginis TaxID=291188 RepID=A0ABY3MAS8_9FLAO|nr:T9SS type A sorting domain-containing protein [Bizionia gelidisalsuginis]TYC12874.1 T9SS type A sorting domain-containing protein [Bizionia gelidisalsuginis]